MKITSKTDKPQQKKHKYRDLLTHLQCSTTAPLSYKEQAEVVGCSERFAKKVCKENLEANIITKSPTVYKSRGRTLTGKNIYGRGSGFDPKVHLIDGVHLFISRSDTKLNINYQTLQNLKSPNKSNLDENVSKRPHTIIRRFVETDNGSFKKFTPKKNTKENLYKYKFAKDKQSEFFNKFLSFEEKLKILKPFGFENHAKYAPQWWFHSITRLKSALRHLRAKLRKGFKCRSFSKFISFLLKHGTFGYRRHVARNTSLAVNRPTIDRIEPYMATDAISSGYEAIRELRVKHNLDVSFSNMQKLLRKGFCHLSMAADVMIKRLKLPGVKNINAFMHHIVSLPEPYDILRRKQDDRL